MICCDVVPIVFSIVKRKYVRRGVDLFMKKEGYVSLWLGGAQSDDTLWEYTQMAYTEDGECLPSQFLNDFHINQADFDEDFMEQIFADLEIYTLGEFLLGCSYDEVIKEEFEKLTEGMNLGKFHAGILLYNFQYDGRVAKIQHESCSLKYVGSVRYDDTKVKKLQKTPNTY